MQKKLQPIILLFFLAFLFSCNGPYFESDNGKTVEIPVGSPFEINLDMAVDDGRTWNIESFDSSVVMPVLSPRLRNTSESEAQMTFYFQVVGDGETIISLVYDSEEGRRGDREFSLQVRGRS